MARPVHTELDDRGVHVIAAEANGHRGRDRQTLLYARDLATLYGRVKADEARRAAHRSRLAHALASSVGSERALVFELAGVDYRLLAEQGGAPDNPVLLGRDVGALGESPAVREGAVWSALGLGESVLVVPIGRSEPVALGVVPTSARGPTIERALALFADLAILALEKPLTGAI